MGHRRIHNVLTNNGYEIIGAGVKDRSPRTANWRDGMVAMYSGGMSTNAIAIATGYTPVFVSKHLKLAGVELNYGRRNPIDTHYFDHIDTEQKAYWLGFIIADGCVVPKGVSIGIKDIEHLALFQQQLGSTYPVRVRPNGCGYLQVTSKQIRSALISLGVTPRKSLTIEYPPIAPEFDRHCIRGIFDGDGCISRRIHRQWKTAPKLAFSIVGSLLLLNKIRDILVDNVGIPHRPVTLIKDKKYASLEWTGNTFVPQIMEWLYDGATVYLDRKHKRYRQLDNVVTSWDRNADNTALLETI